MYVKPEITKHEELYQTTFKRRQSELLREIV